MLKGDGFELSNIPETIGEDGQLLKRVSNHSKR
jgi:hypothetical protein